MTELPCRPESISLHFVNNAIFWFNVTFTLFLILKLFFTVLFYRVLPNPTYIFKYHFVFYSNIFLKFIDLNNEV